MALYQWIERLLLVGISPPSPERTRVAPAPEALTPLIDVFTSAYERFNQLAIDYGRRYRSGFWAIYLLSALAVLFAVLPLALGWDSPTHREHPHAGIFAFGEILVISTVVLIFWRGHHLGWQTRWLDTRTTAELIWYLPVVAPLLDHSRPSNEANWYPRLFDPGQQVEGDNSDVAQLCADNEPLAKSRLACAWSDPVFVNQYAHWTCGILEQQVRYHKGVNAKQHALLERVHRINSWLFGLTALAAITHLRVHTLWLTLVTTFFPALGASLHGAIAQSEAYRLGHTSGRLMAELRDAIDSIERALTRFQETQDTGPLREAIMGAITLILEEHQDWHLLVRPHRLPLA